MLHDRNGFVDAGERYLATVELCLGASEAPVNLHIRWYGSHIVQRYLSVVHEIARDVAKLGRTGFR